MQISYDFHIHSALSPCADDDMTPAMELQTQEDVHVLCLFADYEGLEGFYQSISFVQMENNPEIFGNQR